MRQSARLGAKFTGGAGCAYARPFQKGPSPCCHAFRSYSSSSHTPKRQWSTPLAKTIAEAIQTTGPISLASYMRTCLTSLDGGYYSSSSQGGLSKVEHGRGDQFGKKGDFITSPEISQVFGELVGIWIVAEWMKQGRPGLRLHPRKSSQTAEPASSDRGSNARQGGVELIELGPGRGTLMDDVLRTIRNFPDLASSITAVHLVESSPTLREAQKVKLCSEAAPTEQLGARSTATFKSMCKYLDGVPVLWYPELKSISSGTERTPFILAHEFFDALPIHAFQSIPPSPHLIRDTATTSSSPPSVIQTPTGPISLSSSSTAGTVSKGTNQTTRNPPSMRNQWRELVVTPTPTSSISLSTQSSKQVEHPDFQLSVAKAANPSSMLLPSLSQRYAELLPTAGATIEISPEAQAVAADIAKRIGGNDAPSSVGGSSTGGTSKGENSKGAALIMDYGPSTTVPISTFRGIRRHTLVSPFICPGQVDLSADVDFGALAAAALDASPTVEVHGPVEQGLWLGRMGVKERTEGIVKALRSNVGAGTRETGRGNRAEKGTEHAQEEASKRVRAAVQRLVERGGGAMGRLYKVLAIVPEQGGRQRPVGFGGDVLS